MKTSCCCSFIHASKKQPLKPKQGKHVHRVYIVTEKVRMDGYTRVYRGMHKYTWVYWGIQGYTWVYKVIQGWKSVYRDIQGHFKSVNALPYLIYSTSYSGTGFQNISVLLLQQKLNYPQSVDKNIAVSNKCL